MDSCWADTGGRWWSRVMERPHVGGDKSLGDNDPGSLVSPHLRHTVQFFICGFSVTIQHWGFYCWGERGQQSFLISDSHRPCHTITELRVFSLTREISLNIVIDLREREASWCFLMLPTLRAVHQVGSDLFITISVAMEKST